MCGWRIYEAQTTISTHNTLAKTITRTYSTYNMMCAIQSVVVSGFHKALVMVTTGE